jgi:hypothetical protein
VNSSTGYADVRPLVKGFTHPLVKRQFAAVENLGGGEPSSGKEANKPEGFSMYEPLRKRLPDEVYHKSGLG